MNFGVELQKQKEDAVIIYDEEIVQSLMVSDLRNDRRNANRYVKLKADSMVNMIGCTNIDVGISNLISSLERIRHKF